MTDVARVAEDFFAAWTGKDFERANRRVVPHPRRQDRAIHVFFDARPFAPLFEGR
jgi:hypothetical protein